VHLTTLRAAGLPHPLLRPRPWVLHRQTWARGCNYDALSSILPRRRSHSELDLYLPVHDSDSRGTPIVHAPPHTHSSPLFSHDLPFGDDIQHLKDDNIFRIGFCNIGGFPAAPPPNNKAQELKRFMALYNLDLFGGSESNLNWSKLPDNI